MFSDFDHLSNVARILWCPDSPSFTIESLLEFVTTTAKRQQGLPNSIGITSWHTIDKSVDSLLTTVSDYKQMAIDWSE